MSDLTEFEWTSFAAVVPGASNDDIEMLLSASISGRTLTQPLSDAFYLVFERQGVVEQYILVTLDLRIKYPGETVFGHDAVLRRVPDGRWTLVTDDDRGVGANPRRPGNLDGSLFRECGAVLETGE